MANMDDKARVKRGRKPSTPVKDSPQTDAGGGNPVHSMRQRTNAMIDERIYAAMGNRIRTIRKEKGMTQAQLAAAVGISTSFMGHIERGSRIASLATLIRLTDALKSSLDGIVNGYDGVPHPSGCNTAAQIRVLNDLMRVISEHATEWLKDM